MSSPIISVTELKQLPAKNLIIFDVRVGKEAKENYLQKHIKGAQFVDLEKDLANVPENAAFGGRHPLPEIENFRETLEHFGVNEDSRIVVYDDKNGANAAARLWWMLRAFGLENVQVLDGGFQSAEQENVEFSSGEEIFEKGQLQPRKNWQLPTVTIEDVQQGLADGTATVIDVRDAYRYRGESEPIDVIAGHIPGAINIPFSENLDEKGHFLSKEILLKKYNFQEISPNQKIIVHCGSGVTACHTLLAMSISGREIPGLYVGSWSEWSRRELPVAKEK